MSDRRYYRRGSELFALALDDTPLWHRAASREEVGCTDGLGLVGCGRCGAQMDSDHLALYEDYVVLRKSSLRPTVDVFDRDGRHVVHLAH